VDLSLQHRQVGYVTVVNCRGRLVSGEEADALLQRIDDLLPVNSRILLHLGEVEYIDSGGLELDTVLTPHSVEADAIASAHADPLDNEDIARLSVLCADTSPDVLAYLRGLFKGGGHRVVTAENLHDGLILLKTMRPNVVVMGATLHALRGPSSAEEFHRRVPPNALVVLPATFSSQDAGEAGASLIREVEARWTRN
jgi:CheY-like chemotaxis protein